MVTSSRLWTAIVLVCLLAAVYSAGRLVGIRETHAEYTVFLTSVESQLDILIERDQVCLGSAIVTDSTSTTILAEATC